MTYPRFPKRMDGSNKYGNKSSLCAAGHSHRSMLESSVCAILHMRLKSKEFVLIEAEVRIPVCGKPGHSCKHNEIIYSIVDFKCTKPDGGIVWVESKGFETSDWRLKRRLWVHNDVGMLEIWQGSSARPLLHETIIPRSA